MPLVPTTSTGLCTDVSDVGDVETRASSGIAALVGDVVAPPDGSEVLVADNDEDCTDENHNRCEQLTR